MESLKLLVVATVSDPGFTAVKNCGDTDGLIDREFSVKVDIPVLEDPASEFPEGSCSLILF